ncbi:MAG: PAS domain S-box protein, partial [Syntrophales bacterium]|nr:PAS domain S-box protein [Syntrophales bacterium]
MAWFGSDLFIIRALNRLLGAAKMIREGNLNARVGDHYGHGEIGQLSHAFDEMVDALQQREAERKQAEEAMLASEARYRKLIETSPDAVALVDTNAYVLMINPQGVLLLGYERAEEIIGRHVFDFFSAAEHALVIENNKTLEAGEIKNLEHTMLKKNGATFPAELNAAVILGEEGKPESVIAIFRDITERKRKEDQAQLNLDRLTAFRDIDMAITGSRDLRLTLKVILEQVTKQLTADAALVLLLDYHSLVLGYAYGLGFQTSALQHTRLRIGEGHAGRAALERRIIKSDLPDETGLLERSPLLWEEGFKTYYAVPLIAKGHVKGVLEIFHRTAMTADQEWLDFLEVMVNQAAIAIDNASLFNDLERSNIELTLAYDTTLE